MIESALQTTTATVTTVANRLYAIPIIIRARMNITQLGWRVGAAVGNVRSGIYADNGNTPIGGALLIDCGAVAVLPAVSKQEVACVITLNPGLYWLAMVNDAANQFRGNTVADALGGTLNSLWVAQAYGALPNPFPGGPNLTAVPALYVIGTVAI